MLALFVAAPFAAQNAPSSKEVGPKPPTGHLDLGLFTHSENCVACHNNLSTSTGEDVSIGTSWRSTMMANSARDPYWHAGVRRESIDHPEHSGAIQDECAACHMPMTTRIYRAAGGEGQVFSHLPIVGDDDSEFHRLAADGISCTVCHQIGPDKLGTRESFNSSFVMLPTPKSGTRVIFGPYQVDKGRKTIMRSNSGFEQAKGDHITKSELCASCHTLITQAFGPNGEVIGSLPEQMNYQEWQHSDFPKEEKSCQSCHMPAAKGPIRIASELGDFRESLSRHVFVGGNAFMVRLMSSKRAELGVEALPQESEATAKATVRQLQEDTATLAITEAALQGTTLNVDLDVRNLTGHKFPTGYPSRRTWLHVTVRDAQGRAVFESGAINPNGSITGNDSDADATKWEPHYAQITRPDQVQIYEPILGDRNGVPTTGLLTATQYLKDNRLLPRGFVKATADAEVGVYGDAKQDGDFDSSGDRIHYAVTVPGAGPYRVEAELLYQTIGYRWAHNLEKYDAPEPKRFVGYYNEYSSGSSVQVAHTAVMVR
jgi:cytochrome c551/c552